MKHTTLDAVSSKLQTTKEMSKRYVWMDTKELVERLCSLKSKGQEVFELREVIAPRNRKGQGRGVHIARVKMKHPYVIDGETLYPEIVIKNSYDGSCPLIAELGIFRLVCTNGLVVKSKDLGSLKVRHTGTVWEAVQDMIKGMASKLPQFMKVQQSMALTELSGVQIVEFAKRAASIRWQGVTEDANFEELTTTIRPEDEGNNLWKVFNVVQEKLMVGGIKLDGMKRTARGVKNASENLRINTELFELAMEYANIEGATFTEALVEA